MIALEMDMQELHALLLQADTDEEHVPAPVAPPPALQPDSSRAWALLYEECITEDERITLTREALADRRKLNAPQWAADIGKGETRARVLLRAARKPAAAEAQLELTPA